MCGDAEMVSRCSQGAGFVLTRGIIMVRCDAERENIVDCEKNNQPILQSFKRKSALEEI